MQREVKDGLRERLSTWVPLKVWVLEEAGKDVACELNNKSRKVLSGQTAGDVFCDQRGGGYSQHQREQIGELLNQMVSAIMARMKETSPKTREAAWRMAVETWLQKQGHITVSVNGKVLPYSFRFLCHN